MEKETVCYKRVGDRELTADIYRPLRQSEGASPVWFYTHGGGWFAGGKQEPESMPLLLEAVRELGVAVVSIEYRMGDELADIGSRHLALIGDCFDAVRFFTESAESFGLDTARAITGGISAGGHLALLLAFASARFGGGLPSFRAVIDMCGPTDLFANLEVRDRRSLAVCYRAFFGCDPDEALCAEASPLTYLRKLPQNEKLPAILSVHGELDTIVSRRQPLLLAEEYARRGAPFRLISVVNGDHCFHPAHGFDTTEPDFAELQLMIAEFAADALQLAR